MNVWIWTLGYPSEDFIMFLIELGENSYGIKFNGSLADGDHIARCLEDVKRHVTAWSKVS